MSGARLDAAVIGAGLMGSGIAHVFAAAGHDVAVYDPDAQARQGVVGKIDAAFELLAQDRGRAGSVTVHGDLGEAVAGAGVVVEAAPEDLGLKHEIFATLVGVAEPDALLATNTSALPIGRIAAGLPTRHRILGMHFWNPPYLVPLVEVVEAEATDAGVIADSMSLLRGLGLEPVHVRADIPGFIGNRLQHALKREAIALVSAGICTAEDIDLVTRVGFGARLALMGPLEQSDLAGLELTLQIHETLMPELDRTAEPHPYLVEKVRSGQVGAAVGQGFRRWTPEQASAARDRLAAGLWDAALRRRGEQSRVAGAGSCP
jgi:3-hydroxybutyryl-CoA dehydrogenase